MITPIHAASNDSRAAARVADSTTPRARATYALGAALPAFDRREAALPHLRSAEQTLRSLFGEHHEETRTLSTTP